MRWPMRAVSAGEPRTETGFIVRMQLLSIKSLVVYIAIFSLTLVSGVSLSSLVSPSADQNGFESGRGHRSKDLKMEAELERIKELNEKLTERLELLEEKMETDGMDSQPVPKMQTVPDAPGAENSPGVNVVPVKPQVKAKDQATF